MKMLNIGIIGCGKMGSIIAEKIRRSYPEAELRLSNKTASKAQALAEKLNCEYSDNKKVAAASDFLFIAVKPQTMAEVFGDITPSLKTRAQHSVIVSMAAGISIEKLKSDYSLSCPVIRMMPNTPCAVGEGTVLYSCSDNVSDEQKEKFKLMLASCGLLSEIPESAMDAAGAISGCGPAFAYMFIDALADGGVRNGLRKDTAVSLAAQTVLGSAKMILSGKNTPSSLKDDVCSPGGSTIRGTEALERNAFRAACMDAVTASTERNRELGK